MTRRDHGTGLALRVGMAAVLCLVFLPLMMASVGFLASGSIFASVAFVVLGGFMLLATFNMSRVWDEEKTT